VELTDPGDRDHYCRQIEAYLCRKNDGHLIRIVGPAFDAVCGWADLGVPLNAVYRGIDRYFERYYAKGPRRRPVRVEFCEADVLDVFDEWRRAIGLVAGVGGAGGAGEAGEAGEDVASAFRRKESLPAHLERVVARLTALRGGQDRSLDAAIDDVVREIDAARAGAKGLRGDARRTLIERLRELDARLVDAARRASDAETLDALAAEADAELAPFRTRLPPDAYDRSRQACIDRLLRERAKLPVIALE
jgi:hypothetical protein